MRRSPQTSALQRPIRLKNGVPTITHSTMFVAGDADGRPWNISGNAGNDRIGFGKMLDADIHGVISGFGR